MIHPSAIVSKHASVAENVSIGAFTIVEDDVHIDSDSTVESHVVIRSGTRIGRGNHIFQFCSIGEQCQNIQNNIAHPCSLVIGNNNIFREFCAIHKGSSVGDGITRIGNDNFFMNTAHVGHDCTIGNGNIIAPGSNIGGHVRIGNTCTLGGGTLIHQFCTIGSYTMVSGGSIITGNVPAFSLVYQPSAKALTINRIGMKRNNISSQEIDNIYRAFKALYTQGKSFANALETIRNECKASKELDTFLESLAHQSQSQRTLIRHSVKRDSS